MWESSQDSLEAGCIIKVAIYRDGIGVSYRQAVDAWCTDRTFRQFFIELLAEAPFTAYFWETPRVTTGTADQAFEFVLVDSPKLVAVTPDIVAFEDHFATVRSDDHVVSFSNLRGDALLVVPCPIASPDLYNQLAVFSRNAPMAQQHALWQRVGESVKAKLGDQPLWVSTSGLGVYWLHVRLDAFPKYYSFAPYQVPHLSLSAES